MFHIFVAWKILQSKLKGVKQRWSKLYRVKLVLRSNSQDERKNNQFSVKANINLFFRHTSLFQNVKHSVGCLGFNQEHFFLFCTSLISAFYESFSTQETKCDIWNQKLQLTPSFWERTKFGCFRMAVPKLWPLFCIFSEKKTLFYFLHCLLTFGDGVWTGEWPDHHFFSKNFRTPDKPSDLQH